MPQKPHDFLGWHRLKYAILNRRYFVLFTFLLCVTGSGAYTALSTPIYRAQSSILIENRNATIVAGANTGIAFSRDVTQAQRVLAISGPVLDRAAKLAQTANWEEVQNAEIPDPLVPLNNRRATASVQGQLLILEVLNKSPERAALLADKWAQAFVDEMTNRERSSSVYTREFLDSEIPARRTIWIEKQAILEKFRRETNYDPHQIETHPVRQTYSDLKKKVTDANIRLKTLEIEMQSWIEAKGHLNRLLQHPRARKDQSLREVEKMLQETKRRQIEVEQKFQPYAVMVIQARKTTHEIEVMARESLGVVEEQIRFELNDAKQQSEDLQERLKNAQKEYVELQSKTEQFSQLAFDVEMARRQYEELTHRHQDADVEGKVNYSYAKQWEFAVTPKEKHRPNLFLNLSLGILAGFFISLLGIMIFELTNDYVSDPEKFQSEVAGTVIACIPLIPRKWRSNCHQVAKLYPRAPVTESLRSLRSSLSMICGPRSGNVDKGGMILLTSAVEGEGKSVLASNLAHLFAYSGRRVLLVDLDLYKGTLTAQYPQTNKSGLAELSLRPVTLNELIVDTEVPNLSFLGIGQCLEDPTSLLGSEAFVKVLEALKRQFDYVILDAPPVLAVTDAVLVASHCNAVVMVVRSRKSRIPQVEHAAELLVRSKSTEVQFVLNCVQDIDLTSYSYGYSLRHGTKVDGIRST